jgi:protein-arginine kinase
MKTVTIKCKHATNCLKLQIDERDFCYIQCQLVQIALDRDQLAKVLDLCHCMQSDLQYDQRRAYLTIDPSQIETTEYPNSPWVG